VHLLFAEDGVRLVLRDEDSLVDDLKKQKNGKTVDTAGLYICSIRSEKKKGTNLLLDEIPEIQK